MSICLDFGTSNSTVCYLDNGTMKMLEDEDGNFIIPTCVSVSKWENELIVAGEDSKTCFDKQLYNIHEIKRFVENPDKFPHLKCENGYYYKLEDIFFYFIEYIKRLCSNYIKEEIRNIIVTVPAGWNSKHRLTFSNLLQKCDLNVLQMINEPTAAALYYNKNKKQNLSHTLVIDMGGGTTDITVVEANKEKRKLCVLYNTGRNDIGSSNITYSLYNKVVKDLEKKYELNILKRKNILLQCEEVKHGKRQKIDLFFGDDYVEYNVSNMVIQEIIDKEICPHLSTCFLTINNNISYDVILVGGAFHLEYLRDRIVSILSSYISIREVKSVGEDFSKSVSCGAANLLYKYIPDSESAHQFDIEPISISSIGIETLNGMMTNMIRKGTKLPASATQILTTYEDYQEEVDIKVFEGERLYCKDNHFINTYVLKGIDKTMIRGQPRILVTMHLNESNILTLSAKALIGDENGNDNEPLKVEIKLN